MSEDTIKSLGSFVWSIAELLRGDFKQSEYRKIILPFVVLRRLDCLLEKSKPAVLEKAASLLQEDIDDEARDHLLTEVAGKGINIYNLSHFTFTSLKTQDAKDLGKNLEKYITNFSPNIRDVFLDKFYFMDQIKLLKKAGLLYQVFDQFTQIDLHPKTISNIDMGYLFEDLIRRFSEISNETAGEHYTPREVIHLIVSLLLVNDKQALTGKGVIRQVYDPAAGTGGMLAITEMQMRNLNDRIRVQLFGQELNPESFAICKSDMLVTGHDPENISDGNTLTEDAHRNRKFHYMLSNPPYGVEWKKYADPIKEEHENLGMEGRFGVGLPRISDGQLLFLQHMISKMRNDSQGSRIGIVMNGSPLFTGGAGSGESEIRRWMFENDWVEAIIALPTDIFYNTGIQTYVWLLSNRKTPERRDKVQLIDASGERFWKSMRKSLGSKRKEIPQKACDEITRIYSDMLNGGGDWGEYSKIFSNTDFAYREVRVERPLRMSFTMQQENLEALKRAKPFLKLTEDEREAILSCLTMHMTMGEVWMDREKFLISLNKAIKAAEIKRAAPVKKAILSAFGERNEKAEICYDTRGNIEADTELRDHELISYGENWKTYIDREVKPFVPDAWVDENYCDASDGQVGLVGYEINFNRYFYKYVPLRPLAEIEAEMKVLEVEILKLLRGAVI